MSEERGRPEPDVTMDALVGFLRDAARAFDEIADTECCCASYDQLCTTCIAVAERVTIVRVLGRIAAST